MGKVSKIFKKPKPPKLPPPPKPPEIPEPKDLQAEAEEKARLEQEELRRNRVKTILTSGQGLEDDTDEDDPTKRRTVLGG